MLKYRNYKSVCQVLFTCLKPFPSISIFKNLKRGRGSKQTDNLVLTYTSPENSGRQIMTEEEFMRLKANLLNENNSLEAEMQTVRSKIEEWLKFSEKTFDFVAYSRLHFESKNLEVQRCLFACLDSHLTLKDKKLSITLKKPFQIVAEGLSKAQSELERLEPLKIPENRAKFEEIASEFPILSG